VIDVARAAGRLVGVPLAALARRRQGKPMHPRGAVFQARLERRGGARPWGLPWLDATADERVVVRLSRGAGLPAPLPDLLGLAVRIPGTDGAPVDLLLSNTGPGVLTRYVPAFRRDAAVPYCSIMGYRTDAGVVVLAALPERRDVPSEPGPQAGEVAGEPLAFTLAAASRLGPWRPFARLLLTAPARPLDPDVRFDAVQNPPPGLVPDGPMARFRAPAYAAARAARSG
jgi:hypothetical protein